MYDSTDYMNSSEKLVAFLDGELSQEETGTLFYEIAQSGELQEKMRHFVQIRNSLRNSLVTPPAYLKASIMKTAGLSHGAFYSWVDSGLKTAGTIGAFLYSRTALTALAVGFMALVAVFLLNKQSEGDLSSEQFVSKSGFSNGISTGDIPVIESFSQDSEANSVIDNISTTGSILDKKYSSVHKNSFAGNPTKLGTFANAENSILSDANSNSAFYDDPTYQTQSVFIQSSMLSLSNMPVILDGKSPDNRRLIAQNNIMDDIMQNTSFYIRNFGGRSFPDFNLAGENNPLLNNLSIGFKYNIAGNHSVGIAYGMENFLMSFNKEIDGILYRYDQSWNGSWYALTYHYNFGDFGLDGLQPEISILAAGTSIGPLLRSTAGMNYFITDSFYLNFGIEGGMLMFKEPQSGGTSKWFTTEKIGYTVGFGIGL